MDPEDRQPRAVPARDELTLLEPLQVDHTAEMVPVLADAGLYVFTGGEPPTAAELQARYRRQTVGHSEDGTQAWLNWVIRRAGDGAAVGFVQATITGSAPSRTAEVAWVIGAGHQHRGWARRAAALMVSQLRTNCGVSTVVARIHPDNHASAVVAESLGLASTGRIEDGEMRWEG